MTRNECGENSSGRPGRLEPALHHPADVDAGHRVCGEVSGLAGGRAEERAVGDAGGLDVGEQDLLEIGAHRDFAGLAAFLEKPQRVLRAVVPEALERQLGDGADAGGGVGEDGEDRLVAQADEIRPDFGLST